MALTKEKFIEMAKGEDGSSSERERDDLIRVEDSLQDPLDVSIDMRK